MDEKISNPTNENPITEPASKESDQIKSLIDIEQEPNNSRASQEGVQREEVLQKKDYKYLKRAFDTLFQANDGNFAHPNEDVFSGNAASIMVLISVKNEEGEDIPRLFKVGWGEFSRKTFEGDKYPAFRNFPYDIYCVSQWDSYLVREEIAKKMQENPEGYLSEYSIFVARKGKIQRPTSSEFSAPHLEGDIKATPYEDMLRTVRNQIIQAHTTPEEFAAFLRELPDDPTELSKYVRYLFSDELLMTRREFEEADEKTRSEHRKRQLLHIFTGMGIDTYGSHVGYRESMESMLRLKEQFDFETNSFK